MNIGEIEDEYERFNFRYSKEDVIADYYLTMVEEEDEVNKIFDGDLMLKLIEKNCTWFEYASKELKDDKKNIMKAVEHN